MKKKLFKTAFSIILILLSYSFIAYRIINFEDLKNLSFPLYKLTFFRLFLILMVLLLMILNLIIESIKWRILTNGIQFFSIPGAFKVIMAGITFGIFTPNRVGEIGGRVLFLDKGKRTSGAIATTIGSYAQFLTTLIAGIAGFILFLFLFPEKADINPVFNKIYIFLLVLIVAIPIWLYFNIKIIKPMLLKISFFKKRINQLEYLSETKPFTKTKILLLSILRYFIFSTQFYLLLIFFHIDLSPVQAFASISLTYLFTTLIPTTTLAELGIRGSMSVFFIGMFSANVPSIVFSTLTLWIINLALPAIFGSVFFIKNKLL